VSAVIEQATDAAYLQYQYGNSEKLRIRAETHRRYTEGPDTFSAELDRHLALRPGQALLDVGCGPGTLHRALCDGGIKVVGVDLSLGMLREARDQAADTRLPAHVAQANAQALPLSDATFDRVLAAHMLFHVPDQTAALREMRRVLRPGGRVVLVTNGADFLRRFDDLHREAARELGYDVAPSIGSRFTLDDMALVRSVFPAAERHVLHTTLAFPTVEPALRYYATGMVDRIQDRPEDGSHRPRLLRLVQARIAVIIEREGIFRDPKSVGFFVADVWAPQSGPSASYASGSRTSARSSARCGKRRGCMQMKARPVRRPSPPPTQPRELAWVGHALLGQGRRTARQIRARAVAPRLPLWPVARLSPPGRRPPARRA
jgi:ubiquinone/menaquinone biosynthesis C-methylase UbiE